MQEASGDPGEGHGCHAEECPHAHDAVDLRREDQLKKDDDRLNDSRIVRPAARLVGPEQVPPLRPEATLLKRDVGPRRDDLATVQGAGNASIPPEEPEDERARESAQQEADLAAGHRPIGSVGSRLDRGHAPAREPERAEAEGEEDEGGPLHDRGRAQQRGLIHQRGGTKPTIPAGSIASPVYSSS